MRALIVAALLLGCRSSTKQQPPPAPVTKTAATIRWTSYGIPHIEAKDLRSLAFGQGYATGVLNVCVLADQIVKVRSERAKYFGEEHVESDFGWLALGVMEAAARELPKASADAKALASGFAAGFNQYLAEKPALPPECADKEWVRPISETDLVAYWMSIGMLGSSAYFVDAIARAQPPAPPATSPPATSPPATSPPKGASLSPSAPVIAPAVDFAPAGLASNGWGIGGDRTVSGKGILVANPHFPWEGELRFVEMHLTIPGDIDVYGAQLIGLPLVGIGFTSHHAWTHTFSSSSRFVLYRLSLDGPTTYRYGDEKRELEKRELAIEVKGKGKVKRTAYRSHYGPMLVTDQLAWNAQHAFTLRDVTRSRTLFDQYLAMYRAKSLDEFKAAFATHQTTPFLNTIYADADGNAWYIDGSAVPDLPPAALGAWKMALGSIPQLKAAWDAGVIVLDGSLPIFELATDNAVRPGAIPTTKAPQLQTRDYVMNANDSYWLTNAKQPLTGFSPFYGEPKQPSARTRMNHVLIAEVAKFSRDAAKKQILSNRAMTVELWRPLVLETCKKVKNDKPVEKACAILAAWDGTFSVTAKGAVLWREMMPRFGDSEWGEPYDPARPLETPRGLRDERPALTGIAAAMVLLDHEKIDPGVALGEMQYTERGGKRFGVPGSTWREGSANPSLWQPRNSTLLPAMTSKRPRRTETGLTEDGYPVNYGSSFIMAVSYEADGPHADAILTYSQSTDARSPHATDQTARYGSADPWRPVLFTRVQIDADPSLRVQEVAAP